MQHTTKMTDPPLVTVPWVSRKALPAGAIERAYATCKRADKGHCINTNFVRAFAEYQQRVIRYPATYKGELHWSELVDDQWCMFVAPLSLTYAKKIDAYDHEGKHFWPPVKCPMGPVRFAGFSVARTDTRAQRDERRARLNARIEAGKVVPGARLRELQTPYVAKRFGPSPP